MANALDVIPPNATWDILDASKLTTYMSCPRKYFFRYILGWTPDSPNNHLVFGTAWHLAMEHLLLAGHGPDAVLEAQLLFGEHYRQHFPADTDALYEPKTMVNAFNSIGAYASQFARHRSGIAVLFTELAGLVLVAPDRTMVFKCDAILQDLASGDIFGLDHKTSQRQTADWGEHWTLSTQMLTYLHALHCLYPNSTALKMLVRCAFFYSIQKRTNEYRPTEFAEHSIAKSLPQMTAWLDRTNQWIDRLDRDFSILANEDDTDEITMQAFPQNDTACFNFGRQCAYFDFCNAWPNPINRCDVVPIGFNVEWWNPLDKPEIRTKINLATQSGLPLEMDETE